MRASWALVLCTLLAACAPAPLSLEVQPKADAIEVIASVPVRELVVQRPDGRQITRRSLPRPARTVRVELPGVHGPIVVQGRSDSDLARQALELPDPAPLSLAIQVPLGQPARPVRDGEVIEVPRGETTPVVGLSLRAKVATKLQLSVAGVPRDIRLDAGATELIALPVDASTALEVLAPSGRLRLSLRPVATRPDALTFGALRFPVSASGAVDRARPADRITLPAPWWSRSLRVSGLGYRPRDDQAPWAWQAITLRNQDDVAVHAVVEARVVDARGQPLHAFRPRLRDVDDLERVRALVKVPAHGQAQLRLPVYVDSQALPAGALQARRELRLTPLGASHPSAITYAPLLVQRGSSWVSGGFVLALGAAALGWLALWRWGRRWLRAPSTSELMTVALFGSLLFVVSTASQLLGLGVASVLGPFAPLLLGWADDAVRATLLATLLALVPRVGVITLAIFLGYLMRVLALGSLHPVDAIYLGAAVFWYEGLLWGVGLTRGWRPRRPLHRWLALSLALGGANVAGLLTSLLVSVVLYRLYYAGWYVVLLLAGPGLLYVAIGCWLSLGFGAALREVAR